MNTIMYNPSNSIKNYIIIPTKKLHVVFSLNKKYNKNHMNKFVQEINHWKPWCAVTLQLKKWVNK